MRLINLKNEELLIDEPTTEPIKIIYYPKKEKKNRLKIRIKENVSASIVEVFAGNDLIVEFDREFIVETGAKLEYLKFQNVGENSILDMNYSINLKEDAKLNMTNLELGFGSNKSNYTIDLNAKGSILNINGLVKLSQDTDSKSIFRTVHNGSNCISNIAYKHILDDSSKATFDALSEVNEPALYSKVFQSSNTILLSDDAAIFAQPHLLINIDELEASHGATTGSLDKDQLLYLQSRGIEERKAKEMLLKAFENEIYSKIEDSKIVDFLETLKGDNNV
ncbi:Fe-S assembly protein [Halarcobacter ebronensis]|uniref:Fe-S assembly protein n=1 Tax=Halarcobacter ebronensis TaxID=1462615 RepID=A0A4Q0YDS1_9BACT|nr:SufD family Fe-S cluster assembly protein [Halarcobacter ebronensis]RXJ67714.1 Fe-S assembly protein [Halarcobacter ebronensis]